MCRISPLGPLCIYMFGLLRTVYFTTILCTSLHRTALPALHFLHYKALHCTALHCTAVHCTALHCTALHCIAPQFTELICTTLHCTAIQCPQPHKIALRCTIVVLLQQNSTLCFPRDAENFCTSCVYLVCVPPVCTSLFLPPVCTSLFCVHNS